MKQRIITAIIILLVIIPVLALSEYIVYPIALSIFSLISVFEMLRAIGSHKKLSVSMPAYIIAGALPLFAHDIFLGEDAARAKNYILICAGVLFAYLLYIMCVAVFSKGNITVSEIGEIFFTVTYISISFAALSLVRYMEYGKVTFLLVFIGAWVSDVGAYFVGSFIGKHKLIPEVSPKKTIEGSIGGIVIATLAFILYGYVVERLTDLTADYVVLAVSGVILAVVSQIGDLIASLIKRERGIKDYSNLLPGHGGMMDRFDSIMAVATPLLGICLIAPPFM